jgi:orotidine-5'-phosphate decarboxylase
MRIVTPVEAIRLGSDYLVIGRPITKAVDPLQVLQQINLELSGVNL